MAILTALMDILFAKRVSIESFNSGEFTDSVVYLLLKSCSHVKHISLQKATVIRYWAFLSYELPFSNQIGVKTYQSNV